VLRRDDDARHLGLGRPGIMPDEVNHELAVAGFLVAGEVSVSPSAMASSSILMALGGFWSVGCMGKLLSSVAGR
jgi:hypothetical protein